MVIFIPGTQALYFPVVLITQGGINQLQRADILENPYLTQWLE